MNTQKKFSLLAGMFALVLIIMSLPVYADDLLFSKGQEIDLKVPCENGGYYCSDSAYCNLTVLYPNGSTLIYGGLMTNQESFHNYTIENTLTGLVGKYRTTVACIDGTSNGTSTFNLQVTPSGQDRINSGEGLSLFGSVIVMIIVGAFLFIISFMFFNPIYKIIFIGVSVIILISAVLFSTVIITQNLGGFTSFIEGYATFWLVVKVLTAIFILGLLIFSLFTALKLWRIKRGFED